MPNPPERSAHFDRFDALALLAFTLVAFVLRFYSPIQPNFLAHPFSGAPITDCVTSTPIDPKGDLGTLCGLAYPFQQGSKSGNTYSPSNGQVFDEVYFPADAYHDFKGLLECTSTTAGCPDNYFDPEPPLGKTFIGLGELAYGWYQATFTGAHGSYIDLGYNTVGWRLAACLFGILLVPLFYLLARRLWRPRFFAIATATLVCFDGMFFIQSRIGMIDIFAIFFIVLIYYLFLVHLQSRSARSSILSLAGLGLALGLGIATKWIVLAAASVVFFLLFLELLRGWWPFLDRHLWPRLMHGRFPGGASGWFYLPLAFVNLTLLPVLIYVVSWLPFFLRGQFHTISDLIQYNRDAFHYHATLVATHPFSSPWWSWPFLSRPVYYYACCNQGQLGFDSWTHSALYAQMYDIGNPWIWWTALPCLLALPFFIFFRRSFPATLIALGFITQWLPWSQVTRVVFLYHMFASAIFTLLALAFVLTWIYEHRGRLGRAFAISHLAIAVLAFAYFYPIWTALPISGAALYPSPDSPPWGAKSWLAACTPNVTPAKAQLWCWP
jgi:hypothetical protein